MGKEANTRIWELDFLRGFAIIMMVWDHLMYDLKSLPYWFSNYNSVDNGVIESLSDFGTLYWNSQLRAGGHYVFVFMFLVISGISFNFSRNNLKRSLRFLIVALAITAITLLMEVVTDGFLKVTIVFGIIHLFAVGTFLTWVLRRIWNNDLFVLVVGLGLVGLGIFFRFWDINYYSRVTFANIVPLILGIKGYGADYFGIAPFAGAIMVGSAIGKGLYRNKMSLLPGFDKGWSKPIEAAGRKAFVIFVVHQVVIFTLVVGIMYLLGYRI
jgi:uncharacterized membrane protein